MKARILTLLFLVGVATNLVADNIALCIVATGKYIKFVDPLITSARKYFCTDHKVSYFIFTDGTLDEQSDIVRIEQKRLGWPYDTLMRITMYDKHAELFEGMDYIFALDADMLFVDTVGDEILSDLVATQHPGYLGRRGTYERRKISTACVASNEGSQYFAGGFNGGSREAFLKMAHAVTENIQTDLAKNIIAIWHDESHINRYFIDNPPTKILSPSYCYPEDPVATQGRALPHPKKIIALVKAHGQLQV